MTQHIMITGSNRGIGLAVVERYLDVEADIHIFACCRQPDSATALKQLHAQYPQSMTIVPLEVTNQHSIMAAFTQIKLTTDTLDVLINNAGIDPPQQTLHTITAETMLEVYAVNTVAPLIITQAFLPLLNVGSKVVHISTSMASLSGRTYGGNYAYCSSKAALNMMMRGLASDLDRGVTTIALDPGWARTDMGGQSATISAEQSAEGIVHVVSNLSSSDNGRYLRYDGGESNW